MGEWRAVRVAPDPEPGSHGNVRVWRVARPVGTNGTQYHRNKHRVAAYTEAGARRKADELNARQ